MYSIIGLSMAFSANTGGMEYQQLDLKAATSYTARIPKTPDINQHMTYRQWLEQIPPAMREKYTPPTEIGLDAKVFFENFCGPCSVADNLIYLKQWFPKLRPESDPVVAGTLLARDLGFDYFKTVTEPDPEDFDVPTGTGTSFSGMVSGTLDYLEGKGVEAKKVTLIGFRAHPDERSKYGHKSTPMQIIQRAPKLEEIKAALRLRTIVVQNYGHYKYRPARVGSGKPGVLVRDGGHFVAPVGFGVDKNGKQDSNWMIYRDPAGSDQNKQAQDYRQWLRQPKGAFQNTQLLNFRGDKDIRHKSLADPNWPGYEVFGSVAETLVRDAAIVNPKADQQFEVLEGLVVIQV